MLRLNRRGFLKGAAVAAAGPLIVPCSALGAADRPAPSERIGIGLIGCGPQGTGVMNGFMHLPDTQVLAVCDVNRQRRLQVKKIVEEYYASRKQADYKGCADYNDFRELLARSDVDAVIIATPDHWHAIPTIAAAQAGKDIYCEKPLSLTVAEGRAMADAVKRYGRIFQHGTQQRSDRNFRHAAELALNGRLGQLKMVRVGAPPSARAGKLEPSNPPEGFDYDFWLGQAPVAPYYDNVCQARGWYYMSPYTAGFISGWGVHHVDSAQWGMGTELEGPVEIECKAEYPTEGLYDTATTWDATLRFANGLVMRFTSENIEPHGVRFEGSEGWVHVKRGWIDAEPKSLLSVTFGPGDKRLYESRHHQANLVECIKSRKPTVCPIEVAQRSNSICLLSDIAGRLGRKLKWDGRRERFVDDPEADRMLSRPMRSPWTL